MFNVRTLVLGVAVLALSQSAEAQTGIRISRGGITFQAGLGNRYANPHHSHTLGHGSTHILPY
ncbi:MAG: hypothetical protein KDA85_00085, partial [Planctomycetaceae bacterium]|nr:hypothetical protein [Planctomycetaceae bacterium]